MNKTFCKGERVLVKTKMENYLAYGTYIKPISGNEGWHSIFINTREIMKYDETQFANNTGEYNVHIDCLYKAGCYYDLE